MSYITIEQYKNKIASEIYENYIFIYYSKSLPLDTVELISDVLQNDVVKIVPFKKILTKIFSCQENIIVKKNCP